MTTMFHVTGKACLLFCYVAFIVHVHPSLGSEREYKATASGTTQHTCNTTQSLFLAKQFLFDTVHAVSATDKPTVNAQARVFFFFIASLLPREIIKSHLRHRSTASGREKIGNLMVLSFPVSVDGKFVTNPSVKCPHTF